MAILTKEAADYFVTVRDSALAHVRERCSRCWVCPNCGHRTAMISEVCTGCWQENFDHDINGPGEPWPAKEP